MRARAWFGVWLAIEACGRISESGAAPTPPDADGLRARAPLDAGEQPRSEPPAPDAGGWDAGPAVASTSPPTPPAAGPPPGCPAITPQPVPGQSIAIVSLNLVTSLVVLENVSNKPQTIGAEQWQWCERPSYWHVIEKPSPDLTLAPGETVGFIPHLRGATARLSLPREGEEFAVYSSVGSFDDAGLIRTFVSWGTGPFSVGREYVANEARLWVAGDRIPIGPADAGFVATGHLDEASGYTAVPARCLAYGGPVVPWATGT